MKENEVNFNELFGIDRSTMVTDDLPEPFITCTFVGDHLLFISFFLNQSQMHNHFLWDVKERKVVGKAQQPTTYFMGEQQASTDASMRGNKNFRNFPIKCYHNEDKHEIYCFYR